MALSNIFREPQREITEQAIGLLAIAPFFLTVFGGAKWLSDVRACSDCGSYTAAFIVWSIVIAFCLLVGVVMLILGSIFIHFIGERICDALQDAGLRLRPERNR